MPHNGTQYNASADDLELTKSQKDLTLNDSDEKNTMSKPNDKAPFDYFTET